MNRALPIALFLCGCALAAAGEPRGGGPPVGGEPPRIVCDENSCRLAPSAAPLIEPIAYPEGEPPERTTARSAGIDWVSTAEAARSPKPDWFHVTLSRGCVHCARADRLLECPLVAAASRAFDCVRLVDPDVRHPWCVCYGVRVFPCDRLTSPDGRRCWRADGVPSVPTGTVGVPEYLHLLHNAQEYLAGRQVGFRDAPASARWANSE